MSNKFIESTLDYLNVKSLEESPFMLNKTVIDSSKYLSLENYMIHLEDIRDGKDIPANLIETFKDPESERESTPKLQIGDDDLGMLLELPAYLYDDEVNSFDYSFYPLDSNLGGFTRYDIQNLHYTVSQKVNQEEEYITGRSTNPAYQKINIARSIPHENLCSSITDFSNDPLFNHEGLQSATTDINAIQTLNLLTLLNDDDSFCYGFTCSDGYLSNIAKLKKIIIGVNSNEENIYKPVLYNQNYALSEECFVAIASPKAAKTIISSSAFNIEPDKYYSISFYAKLVGAENATITSQLYNMNSRATVKNPTASFTYKDITEGILSETLNITSSWKRFMTTFKPVVTAVTPYSLQFSIPSEYAKESTYIMLCGILVEQSDCMSPYDSRKHSLDINKVNLSEHVKAYVSIIGLDAEDTTNDDFSLANNNWLIAYKRVINSYTKATTHVDSLGTDIHWGFRSNGNSSTLIEDSNVTLEDIESQLEDVIVYKLNNAIFNRGYINGTIRYSVQLDDEASSRNYSLCYKDTSTNNHSHATGFNLQLGGEGFFNRTFGQSYNDPKRYSGSYKELLFVKKITEEKLETLINSIVNAQFSIELRDNETLLVTNDLMEKL